MPALVPTAVPSGMPQKVANRIWYAIGRRYEAQPPGVHLGKYTARFTPVWHVSQQKNNRGIRYRGRVLLWDLHQVWLCAHFHTNRDAAQDCAARAIESLHRYGREL